MRTDRARCGTMGDMDTNAAPPAPDFTRTKWGEGYDPGEVDALVARIRATLEDGSGRLTAADVEAARITPTRPGYDMDEVDDYLDALKVALAAAGHVGENASARAERSAPHAATAPGVQEQRTGGGRWLLVLLLLVAVIAAVWLLR